MTNFTTYASIESAMSAQKAITGGNYCDEYENEHKAKLPLFTRLNVTEFMVADNGDIYYICKFNGERIMNKLELHTSISAGYLDVVFFNGMGNVSNRLNNIVEKGNKADRKQFAKVMNELHGEAWAYTTEELA